MRLNLTLDEERLFAHIAAVCAAVPDMAARRHAQKKSDLPQVTALPIARVAGGWVRDKILQQLYPEWHVKNPKDIDISLDTLTGEQFSQFLRIYDKENGTKLFTQGISRSQSASQVEASLGNRLYGFPVEFLQLRKESYSRAGDRHSVEIEPAKPEEDALRRDLTINALYYNILTGEVEDFVGGLDDIRRMILRTPVGKCPNPEMDGSLWRSYEIIRVFDEDPIRILRILRFYARFPKATIAPEVVHEMRRKYLHRLIVKKTYDHSLTKNVPGVPPEKLSEELFNIMRGQRPAESLRILYEVGLLEEIANFPDHFCKLHESQKNKHHNLSFIDHTLEVVRILNDICLANGVSDENRSRCNMAALVHDWGKLDPKYHRNKEDGQRSYPAHAVGSADQWMNLAKALKIDNQTREFIFEIVLTHMSPHEMISEDRKYVTADDDLLLRFVDHFPRWEFTMMHAEADSQAKKSPNEAVRHIYVYLRTFRIPNLPGLVVNDRRNPKSRKYLSSHADSKFILPDPLWIVKPGDIIDLIGLPPVSKPRLGMSLPVSYIAYIKQELRKKQYAGWVPPTAEEIMQAVKELRPTVIRLYGPRASADVFKDLPEFAHLQSAPQWIGYVKDRIQERLLEDHTLDEESQRQIALGMRDEVYAKFGNPPHAV